MWTNRDYCAGEESEQGVLDIIVLQKIIKNNIPDPKGKFLQVLI